MFHEVKSIDKENTVTSIILCAVTGIEVAAAKGGGRLQLLLLLVVKLLVAVASW